MEPYNQILSFENNISKELYEDTIKQRNQLNNKFAPTITILSAEISGIIWVIFNLKHIKVNHNLLYIKDMCVFSVIVFTIIFNIIAIINFVICFTNYEFSYPKPDKIKEFIDANKQCRGDYSDEEILNNILEEISQQYMIIAINNCIEINNHSKYLNKCYIYIIATLMFMAFDFILIILF